MMNLLVWDKQLYFRCDWCLVSIPCFLSLIPNISLHLICFTNRPDDFHPVKFDKQPQMIRASIEGFSEAGGIFDM